MPDADAVIHLRVPATIKGRWVRESRAAGMRLGDWIIQRMERPMTDHVAIIIPADLVFADLKLARDASGDVSFDMAVIQRIERASGLQPGYFMARPEGALGDLLARWYATHRAAGGAPDPVQDDLIAEASAEDAAGQPYSHQPGLA